MSFPEPPSTLLALEEEILELWREEDLFRRSLEWSAAGEPFVFYEGPPTANGRPGLHHIISRAIKDLICRYQTMRGRSVTRIAGWDTHGLPVEIETEKQLGISGKPEIEEFGIAAFNEANKKSVFAYKEDWESLSERIGYWLDYSRPYVTYHTPYIESVWWILAELAGRGLMYRGQKSVPYCPRCGTALSSHEVAQGYQDVRDPSLYFLCEWLASDGSPDPEGRRFIVWTTTPWTVPSNVGLAVHPELTYTDVEVDGQRYVVAEGRAGALFGEDGWREVARYRGSELIGRRYGRPLDVVPAPAEVGNAWTVVAEEFVSADDGTGLVHLAPAFGADDHAAGLAHDLPMLRPIDDEARFHASVAEVGGLYVKDADPRLVELLDERGLLFKTELYEHSYPHCWRCDSPLIYMARDSWFAATSTLRDELLANNDSVVWAPPEAGSGRFGEWLRGNVDWALSRDRFWGTPLPVWLCDGCDAEDWIGSLAALGERVGGLPADFDPHRPFIDELTWGCSECDGTMRRTPEVIDVWFDSGAMPFAQWHYPFENQEEFGRHFPADFICEGLDQTRGWFYSLMAISTLLGRGSPYKSVIVNGLILDSAGLKMSKTRGNAVDPWDAINAFGADAVRWYLMTVSAPWADKRYDPDALSETTRRFFDTLLNTYRFFSLYARTESWSPSAEDPPPESRPTLDRWVLGRLDELVASVNDGLEHYDLTRAYRAVQTFVLEDLSNWYVRRSRARFWGNSDLLDQRAAFRTLWDSLRTVSLLVAPVTPFLADWMHRALTGSSAHLTAFPLAADAEADTDADARDDALDREMDAVRELSRLGRAAREEVRVRVRQPLRELQAVVPGGVRPRAELLAILQDELNVKAVEFLSSSDGLVEVSARPNYRALGPRFQGRTEEAASRIRELSADRLRAYRSGEATTIEVDGEPQALEPGDLDVVEQAHGGLAVQSSGGYTAALDPSLDDELIAEGLAREIVNRVQRLRKDTGLEITDRIELAVGGPPEVTGAAQTHRDFIAGEVLATSIRIGGNEDPPGDYEGRVAVDLDGRPAALALRRDVDASVGD